MEKASSNVTGSSSSSPCAVVCITDVVLKTYGISIIEVRLVDVGNVYALSAQEFVEFSFLLD